MASPDSLIYCDRCKRSMPRGTFKTPPGGTGRRKLCAECYDSVQKTRKAEDSQDIERAVYDGMQDLRTKKDRSQVR